MNTRRFTATTRWVAAFSALAAIVQAYKHWVHVNPTTVALTLVLFILVLASQWELRYAVVVSFVATAAYNFYFLPPLGTFTISDPQNWLALFTFLGTGIVGSRLSQRARDEAATALHRQRELEVLYLLSRDLLQTESVAATVQAIPRLINTSTQARSVSLYLLEGDRLYRAGLDEGTAIETHDLRNATRNLSAVTQSSGNEARIPLRTGVRPRGLLTIRGASLTPESLEAVGGLVSITLDHAEAIEAAAKAEAAKESERLRTLILDSIAHELRTPLTSIKGAAGTLLTNPDIDRENRQELISVVDEEADRLNHLVGQALEMARIEAREVQMHFEPLAITDVIEESLQTCGWVANTHPIEVILKDLPAVSADRELLSKVVCNLIENAAKYSSPGSPITITARTGIGDLAVSIADLGVGIEPFEQSLIFDRLYRSRSQSEKTPGTGMGLAICRAIMEAHHGDLKVTSQLGHGSVFTFSIPLAA